MKHKNILIVEDEMIIALSIKNWLEPLGFEVVDIVGTGEEAIDIVEKNETDLIIMDIGLKGKLDGISTIEKIKTRSDVPFIFLTANSMSNYIDRAKKTHPFGYLTKPFFANEICDLASAALEID